MSSALQGQVIVNTRPMHQQAGLSALLESVGASVVALPAIEITETPTTPFLQNLARNIADYQVALFISRNAVDGAFRYIGDAALPEALLLGVIGDATRTVLAGKVRDLDARLIRNEFYDSEGLLGAPALQQVDGKNILIFRGQQGRNLLGDELSHRGARVSYCEVYRRRVPVLAPDAFERLFQGATPTLILFTSNQGMGNLVELADRQSRKLLLQIPWLLISERMRESALKLGHNASIIIAINASDEGIRQTICAWSGSQ